MRKTYLSALIFLLVSASPSGAAPAGICLHGTSPEAAKEKLQCFEFEKIEREGENYRFFVNANRSVVLTPYRYRGIIPYKSPAPMAPDFAQILKVYEDAAEATPATRPFLNPRILALRDLAARFTQEKENREKLPTLTLGDRQFVSPKFKAVENGQLSITHQDGTARIDLDKIDAAQLKQFSQLDRNAAKIVIVEIAGKKVWNPSFGSLTDTHVKINHAQGELSLPREGLAQLTRDLIESWSDGTWKLAKPGFYGPKAGGGYSEVVLPSGKFYEDVAIAGRIAELVELTSSGGHLKIPFVELAKLSGVSEADAAKILELADEIINERFSTAIPKVSQETLSFDEEKVLNVTNVRARILQVLGEGVLASEFVGDLHKGMETVRTTKTASVEHPITGELLSKVVDTSTRKVSVDERVSDDLCYIVGNTKNLTENSIVKVDSMILAGRYQYNSVAGAERTVRKYQVK